MKQVDIQPVPDNLQLKLTGNKIALSPDMRKKVEDFWHHHAMNNPSYFNGEIFTITKLDIGKDAVRIELTETDFKHHLYTAKIGDLGEHNTHTIYPAVVVISSDDKVIFGRMGKETARAGLIQCCGGVPDNQDVRGDGTVDITKTAEREMAEELGLDAKDPLQVKSLGAHYLTTGGNESKMALVFIAHLELTAEAFMNHYNTFIGRFTPEFSELFAVQRTPAAAQAFLDEHAGQFGEEFPIILTQVVQ